ncbi:flagellar protein FlgJ [Balnearium lithotrophicum]|uniref:Flagellar protein FlgJ n=1 Tax=Balnearium lithotrophicum TaxID=223788 RepID=A0A521CCU3_9BACT|nr:flagellar biosynthesis protein FlgJ [Balnearium lithotrophicum]SMO56621.1 flagellar protein FlgJ [Balnearium lithotrophicum]
MKVNIPVYWDLNEIHNRKNLKFAVSQFEVYLVREYLKEAKKSIPDGLLGTFSSSMYYDLFNMELSQIIGDSLGRNFETFFEKAINTYTKLGSK